MRILRGKQARNFREAAALALREAGVNDMSLEVVGLFASAIDINRFMAEAHKSIKSAVHGKYGHNATWEGKPWFIPVSHLSYKASSIPLLAIDVQTYLVSAIEVETADNYYPITLVDAMGKPVKLLLPVPFLQAILDDNLDQFEVIAKDGTHTGWSMPGFSEALRLPNDFTTKLSSVLKPKSVATWLLDFGSQGRGVAPLVVGSLLGLQFHGAVEPVPTGQQLWKRESVLDALTRMFGTARAKEMFEQAAPYLKANMTNEEVIRLILQEAGKEYWK